MLAGCDAGHPELEDTVGPPLRVVSTYPEDGAGFECPISDLECGVPIDAVLEIRFDRYLLPSTAVRQSFTIYTGREGNTTPSPDLPALSPRYDVVERVVSYSLPTGATLQPNTHYTMELVVPTNEDAFGFRAFDARPLDEETIVRTSFLTSNQKKAPPPPEPAGTCATTESTLRGLCASGGCHNASDRRMGLDLSSASGLVATAIGYVAHQTETGPKTGTPTQNPDRFGEAMPLIDPGRPDNSYLFYKLLLSPENYWVSQGTERCKSTHEAPVGDDCGSMLASPEENARLRDWFLRGVGMPRPAEDREPVFLTRQLTLELESWIRSGAACP